MLSVQTYLFAFFTLFMVFVGVSMERMWNYMREHMMEVGVVKAAFAVARSDWTKALFLLCFPFAPPGYFLVSMINKAIRNCRGVHDKRRFGGEYLNGKHAWLDKLTTRQVSHQFAIMQHWNWTAIVGKMYFMGIVLFIMLVGSTKALNYLLVHVNLWFESEGFSAWVILGLWYMLGLIGFLNPAIPGPPIYLFGGLVCAGQFESMVGFWGGIIIVCLASWILKLNACAMQQKCFGEGLGSIPTIRAAVGVHQPFIRAIEVVLKTPGLSVGKCSILVGGPDWPTSVLCGLLRCSLFQIMLGTTPILFFIAPTVFAGAFYLKPPDSIYASLASLMFVLSAIMCGCFGVAATYAFQGVLDEHYLLLTIPLRQNLPLHWIDYVNAKKATLVKEKTEWSMLPAGFRIYYVSALPFVMLQNLQKKAHCQLGTVIQHRAAACATTPSDSRTKASWKDARFITLREIVHALLTDPRRSRDDGRGVPLLLLPVFRTV